LDSAAPVRAQRHNDGGELPGAKSHSGLLTVAEEDNKSRGQVDGQEDDVDRAPKPDETPHEAWGESFKIEWLCTDRLPFYRTRHLRNPWNHDREIKVSRDGTELEPSVGQSLLEEWENVAAESAADVDGETAGAASTPALLEPLERDSYGGKEEKLRS